MPSTFGTYLKTRRVAANRSLRDVAREIGISHVALGEVERGERVGLKRERWVQLQEAIPGFSVSEVEAMLAKEQPMQLDLRTAPVSYQRLGVELARRMEKRNLADAEIESVLRILRGGCDDE